MLKNFLRNKDGNMTITTAIAMIPIMSAVVGITDLTNLGNQRDNVQHALDSAALAIAGKIGSGMTNGELKTLGADVFHANVNSSTQLDVEFDYPGVTQVTEDDVFPGVSLKKGDVYVSVSADMVLDSYFRYEPARDVHLTTRVALASIGKPCILALNTAAPKALEVGGTSVVSMENCSIMSNSEADDALYLGGSADVSAVCAGSSGGISAFPDQFDVECPFVRENIYQANDPFSEVPTPPYTTCKNLKKNETYITSGTYCDFKISGDVTLEPGGIFVIRPNGPLSNGNKPGLTVLNNDSLTGENVTFFLMGGAEVKINGGANINLTAKTSGDYAGMLIYSEASSTGDWIIGGGNDIKLIGIVYNPGGHVDYHGNNATTGECLRLVADTIRITGTSSFKSECDIEFGGLDMTASSTIRIAT